MTADAALIAVAAIAPSSASMGASSDANRRESAKTRLWEKSEERAQAIRDSGDLVKAKRFGAYDAASALDITGFLYAPRMAKYLAELPVRLHREFQNPE